MQSIALALTLGGYVMLMLTNPVRESLADGWRCVRRYPVIWRTIALLALANALFLLAVRLTHHLRETPELVWMRAGWNDPTAWLTGTPDSLWWLPPAGARDLLGASVLPGLEFLAGIFNGIVVTFPVAMWIAGGLIFNRHGWTRILFGALRRRIGAGVWLVFPLLLLAGCATWAKAIFYFRPQWIPEPWWPFAPSIAAISSLFEYLVSVAVQGYLILHAYAWVRGLSFDPAGLREVAIRRFGAASKWAGCVMLVQALTIELPLALSFLLNWPAHPELVSYWLQVVRLVVALCLIGCFSMQAWLILHGESLRRALRGHFRLLRTHLWEIAWFIIVAAVHCWAVHFLRLAVLKGLGEDTAFGLGWSLCWPIVGGLVGGWLLASWVCLFKRCE
jgi:hypothetical protein